MCGAGFSARSDAVYCSSACRQKAHRVRTARRLATARSGPADSLRSSVAGTIQRAREQVDRSRELCRISERHLRESEAIVRKRAAWPGN